MIDIVVLNLKKVFSKVILVTNDVAAYEYLGVKLVKDVIPGMGPLSGMHAGLLASGDWYNFIIACDMPFLEPALIRFMLGKAEGYDIVAPRIEGYFQPLHAVYARSCIEPIQECLKQNITKIVAFYPQMRLLAIEEEDLRRFTDIRRTFFNINTPEELQQARLLAKGGGRNAGTGKGAGSFTGCGEAGLTGG
ncbi:MAG: molybdenum cofactor guanylyltransferase [Clostridia bacterium]|nr:molybdenum cofactor guanylyltransferase [Clostridia bacterium]